MSAPAPHTGLTGLSVGATYATDETLEISQLTLHTDCAKREHTEHTELCVKCCGTSAWIRPKRFAAFSLSTQHAAPTPTLGSSAPLRSAWVSGLSQPPDGHIEPTECAPSGRSWPQSDGSRRAAVMKRTTDNSATAASTRARRQRIGSGAPPNPALRATVAVASGATTALRHGTKERASSCPVF